MPSSLALLLTVVAVLALVVRDAVRNSDASGALWLPVMWLVVTGSRFLSQWLELWGLSASTGSDAEGSTIDALYFGLLILAGTLILLRRRLDYASLVRGNAWLLLFIVYCLISIAWSDTPFIAFKRWTKAIGHPVMAMLILSDADPVRATKIVLRRCTYVLMPFSVLLIKYFPEYGRMFDAYSGRPTSNGVALTKNGLGYICLVCGLFLVWQLLERDVDGLGERRWISTDRLIDLALLAATFWLLEQAESATSIVAFAVGSATMLTIRLGIVSGRRLTAVLVIGLLLGWSADYLFGLYEHALDLLGKDATLTDRTLLWRDVIALQDNPLLGTGFESFWLGPRLDVLWEKWWWRPNQAHNGYIETWLNLGYVGLVLLVATILAAYAGIRAAFLSGSALAAFQLALLVAIIMFNFTEAAFKGVHFIWTMFYLVAIRYAQPFAFAEFGQMYADAGAGFGTQR